MSTSDKAFNQVKAILGKLDRSIDQAREKRLQGPVAPTPPLAPAPAPVAVVAPPAPAPVNPGVPNGAAYGRAKPLNRPPMRGPESTGPTIWR